ncbi:InlB B-repeat-containing protein, partial [Anaerotignum lactatifermentans]|uniref:InlB B-repeat-containing protein n=1 Tax=Anaerotignum lactatifermentans TaxID=160404 RepID=UPI0027B95459
MRKRIFAAFVCLCMMMALVPSMTYANDTVYTGGLCEHHTQHDGACGYTEGTAEIPCSHEHNESCGGLTNPTACNHTHDETCGYVPATAGTPCTFVCEVCNPQDNGDAATPSDAQPEECTCETLYTGEEVNADCPVCSAEGAELDKVCVDAALMLPVTALAAAPQTLYVGDYRITNGSDITYLKAGSTAGSLVAGSENDWTVKYEPSTATLTLNGATIMGDNSATGVSYGAGIYAQCSNGQSVTLTIKLIGENTITGNYGIYVNAEISENSNGTDASLTITGENNGSLGVSGSDHGIYVKSGSGDASLNIKNVAVTSSTNGNYAAGVYVMSSSTATNSPNISLTVNGGSLTTSGSASGEGIKFYVGSSQATDATTNLTVTDNAIVDARNGGISAKQISNPINTDISATDSSGGIVFNGKNGTVYGNVTLQEDLEIGEGESLTLDSGASLNAGNYNVIVDGGTLDENLANSLGNNVKYAPAITNHPQNVEVKENETATFTIVVTGTEPLSYQWQQSTDKGSGWMDITGETNASYTIATTTTDMNDWQYRCVVKNSIDEVTSDAAKLTVQKSSGGSVFFWDLKFDTNGGSKIDTVTEWEYSTIDLDEYVPEKEGYKFVGWYADEDLTKKIDEVYLTQDTTVYAKWEKIEEEVPEEPDEVEETEETETISFKDVKENDWFYEAVSYAVENGLMSGMSEDVFAPNTPLTREMLAVV